jgi:DnaA family protein
MSTPRQLTLDLIQPLTPSLDNFVVGRNAEVIAALRALQRDGARFIYLWGEAGAGRSHLLRALGLTDASASVPEFAAGIALYGVDDVDRLDAAGEQRLFVLLNEVRAHPVAGLVATGNAPPAQLALRADVRTRLAWGLVYQVHGLSDDEKSQALQAHAASRGLTLPAEVIAYLLHHMPRDMRALVAILDALDAYALATKRALTVPLVREWAAQSAA